MSVNAINLAINSSLRGHSILFVGHVSCPGVYGMWRAGAEKDWRAGNEA